MKPGSIASRGYTKDSIRPQAVPRFASLALSGPPKANGAKAAAQENKPRSRSGPSRPRPAAQVLDDRRRRQSEPREGHRDGQLRNRATRNGCTNTTGVNMSAAAPSRMSGAGHPGRANDKQIQDNDIPGGRKAAKPQIVGLHPGVGEIERRRDGDDKADPERGLGRHQVRAHSATTGTST